MSHFKSYIVIVTYFFYYKLPKLIENQSELIKSTHNTTSNKYYYMNSDSFYNNSIINRTKHSTSINITSIQQINSVFTNFFLAQPIGCLESNKKSLKNSEKGTTDFLLLL